MIDKVDYGEQPEDFSRQEQLDAMRRRLIPDEETLDAPKPEERNRLSRRIVACIEGDDKIEARAEVGDRLSARIEGELERVDADIEPLPPTPITDNAKVRLLSWGLTEEDITKLCELTSSFRYDLCTKKAKRLTENVAYLYTTDDGAEEIIIPDFFATSDRGDGQCRDITTQWIRAFNRTFRDGSDEQTGEQESIPLYTRLIHAFRGRKDEEFEGLIPLYINGKSRTHFHHETSSHIFSGLLKEGRAISEAVIFDASFQEISNLDDNGYRVNPDRCYDDPGSLTGYEPSSKIPVGKYSEDDHGWSTDLDECEVLGMSADGKLSYIFTFLKDTETGQIKPFVQAQNAEAEAVKSLTYGRDGRIQMSEGNKDVTPNNLIELSSILHDLNKISLIRDQKTALAMKNATLTVPMHGDWKD